MCKHGAQVQVKYNFPINILFPMLNILAALQFIVSISKIGKKKLPQNRKQINKMVYLYSYNWKA